MLIASFGTVIVLIRISYDFTMLLGRQNRLSSWYLGKRILQLYHLTRLIYSIAAI